MTGAFYLGGGGDASDEAALWREILDGKARVVYWPFALPAGLVAGATEWLAGSLHDLDLDVEVETWTDLGDHRPAELASADLLFVGGGNTFQLLHHVRSHAFLGAVRDFVSGGGDYYGGSAGAILACSSIEIAAPADDNDVGLIDLTALGLVAGFTVLPHFRPERLAAAQAWSVEHRQVVVGIPETSAVAVRDGSARAVGDGVWEVAGTEAVFRDPGMEWVPSGD